MKNYEICIREILEKTVTVRAESLNVALYQVLELYYASEHVLGSENFKEVSFLTQKEDGSWQQEL